jgi:hypothetical protein
VLVDDDAVVDLDPARLREVGAGQDSQPGDHDVGLDRAAAFGLDAKHVSVPGDAADLLAREHVDALLAVVAVDELRKLGREDLRADAGVRKEERDVAAVHVERGAELRADEPASDDRRPSPLVRERAKPAVVVERAVVDDALVPLGNPARRSAGCEQEPLEGVGRAGCIGRRSLLQIERRDRIARVEVDAELGRPAPDGVLGLSLPEPFRQRRAGVRLVRVLAEEPDRALLVVLADSLACSVGGHSATDDQVPVIRQLQVIVTRHARQKTRASGIRRAR